MSSASRMGLAVAAEGGEMFVEGRHGGVGGLAPPTGDDPLRVMIVDDNPSYAEGLSRLLTSVSDIDVVAVASDTVEAMEIAETRRPHIVLIDARLPERTAFRLTQEIQETFPTLKVAMISASCEQADVDEALQAGVQGYLLKQSDIGQLAEEIKAIHSGEIVIEPWRDPLQASEARPAELTDREVHLLKLLAKGFELARIGRELCVSQSTVKREIVQLQRKLDVANRIQAVVAAVERGIL